MNSIAGFILYTFTGHTAKSFFEWLHSQRRCALQSQDLYWHPTIYTSIPRSTLELEDPLSTLKCYDPHFNPRIHTGIKESTLKYQYPHRRLKILGSTLDSQHLHWNPRIGTEILLSILHFQGNPTMHWNQRMHTEIPAFELEFQDPFGNLRNHSGLESQNFSILEWFLYLKQVLAPKAHGYKLYFVL